MSKQLPGIPKRIHVSSWFCFNVRTGSLIIGLYNLLLSIAWIFGTCALTSYLSWYNKHYKSKLEIWENILIFSICSIPNMLLIAFINGVMIAGVMTNKPYLMYPWIYFEFIKFIFGKILNVIVILLIFVCLVIFDDIPFAIRFTGFIAFLCMNIIISFIINAIDIYFSAPVVAHCRRLLDKKENTYSPYKESNEGLIEMGNQL